MLFHRPKGRPRDGSWEKEENEEEEERGAVQEAAHGKMKRSVAEGSRGYPAAPTRDDNDNDDEEDEDVVQEYSRSTWKSGSAGKPPRNATQKAVGGCYRPHNGWKVRPGKGNPSKKSKSASPHLVRVGSSGDDRQGRSPPPPTGADGWMQRDERLYHRAVEVSLDRHPQWRLSHPPPSSTAANPAAPFNASITSHSALRSSPSCSRSLTPGGGRQGSHGHSGTASGPSCPLISAHEVVERAKMKALIPVAPQHYFDLPWRESSRETQHPSTHTQTTTRKKKSQKSHHKSTSHNREEKRHPTHPRFPSATRGGHPRRSSAPDLSSDSSSLSTWHVVSPPPPIAWHYPPIPSPAMKEMEAEEGEEAPPTEWPPRSNGGEDQGKDRACKKVLWSTTHPNHPNPLHRGERKTASSSMPRSWSAAGKKGGMSRTASQEKQKMTTKQKPHSPHHPKSEKKSPSRDLPRKTMADGRRPLEEGEAGKRHDQPPPFSTLPLHHSQASEKKRMKKKKKKKNGIEAGGSSPGGIAAAAALDRAGGGSGGIGAGEGGAGNEFFFMLPAQKRMAFSPYRHAKVKM